MARDDATTNWPAQAGTARAAPAGPAPVRQVFDTIDAFRAHAARGLGKGPLCALIVEDRAALAETLRHLDRLGFVRLFYFAPPEIPVPAECADMATEITIVHMRTRAQGAAAAAVNALIPGADGAWVHYCHNAEFLFFPFCENRTVGEVSRFMMEERRQSVLTYVVDLYAEDLRPHPDAVDCASAHLDGSGYFADARLDETGQPRDRQLDFFGGLRWRFEEHIPAPKRRIDRVGLFQAHKGLTLRPDHTMSYEEMNTYACPWHHSLTGALASFRVAKALRSNPGSRFDVDSFMWHGSVPFRWSSRQLMEMGLIEPGQWF